MPRTRRLVLTSIWMCSLLAVAVDPARAERAADGESEVVQPRAGLPEDDEAGKLEFDYGPVGSRLGEPMDKVLAPYDAVRSFLKEAIGLDYIWYYSPVVQGGSQRTEKSTAHHEISWIGDWSLIESERYGTGGLRFWFLHQLTYGSTTTREFSDAAGSIFGLNGGPAIDHVEALGLLWYEHWLLDESLVLVAGKLDARQLVSRLRYVGDDRQDFQNHSFFNKPVQPIFQGASLGVFSSYEWDWGFASLLAKDADADSLGIDFRSLGNGNFQYAAEFGLVLKPAILGGREGRYRLTGFFNQASQTYSSKGWGVAAAFDQDVTDRLNLFLRISRSEGQRTLVKTLVSSGVVVHGVGPWRDDSAGVGFSWGDPSNRAPGATRDQYDFEFWWNMQITRRLRLTPDLQFVIDPATNRGRRFIAVGGVRLYVQF